MLEEVSLCELDYFLTVRVNLISHFVMKIYFISPVRCPPEDTAASIDEYSTY